MNEYADPQQVVAECMGILRPPPKLRLSEWADEHFHLSAESSAEAGRWKTLPYQRGLLDAITDPTVTQVSVMKSARVGFTKCMNAAIGYYMHQDPCSILVVQPTVDDAKGYSKEEIAPMLRDSPTLSRIVFEDSEENGPRDSGNTILHKRFPGGVLAMVGANSGAGFRRVSRRVVMFDEVDAYPPSAGSDGDPIKLGIKRTEYFWNRKIIAGSTPLIAGASRITELFEQGDQRRYFVPCPQCGHMAPFVFTLKDGETAGGQGNSGHVMRWPEGKPQDAFFECERNGCVIEHRDKRAMVAAGEWRASGEFRGHASFHIWAAYSFSPNATWAHLAEEFLEARGTQEKLKTFINTALGETWTERGEAPDWERLYQRRERYQIGSVPDGAIILTAGVDVQKDRFVYLVQGWGIDKQNWTVDAGVLMGDTSNAETWKQLDDLLNRTFPRGDGTEMAIRKLAVDSGYNTNEAYTWARRAGARVMAVKGQDSTAKVLLGTPTAVDLDRKGKRIPRALRVWPVGTHIAKTELYGWLRQSAPVDGDPFPPGYVHFPELDGEFFKQLTGEQLVSRRNKKGFVVREWEIIPGRENHYLDTWVYARAAATSENLDKASRSAAPPPPAPVVRPAGATPVQAPAPRSDRKRPRVQGGWLSRRR